MFVTYPRCKVSNVNLHEKSGKYFGQIQGEYESPLRVKFNSLPTIPMDQPIGLDAEIEVSEYKGITNFTVVSCKHKVLN